MTKQMVLLIIFGCLKLLLENLVGYLWLLSVHVLSNIPEFKLCFALYINFKTWKVFIWQTFKTFTSLINGYTHSMLLFLQNFIKFSSSCASPCYIAMVYIVMNRGEICFPDLFCLDNVKPYIVYLYFWYFILSKLCMFILCFRLLLLQEIY